MSILSFDRLLSILDDKEAVLMQDKVSQIADYEAYVKSLEESNNNKEEK